MDKRTSCSCFKNIANKYTDNPAIDEADRSFGYSMLDAMVDSILTEFCEKRLSQSKVLKDGSYK